MFEPDLEKIKFQVVIDALLDDDADFPIIYFPSFSDLEGDDLKLLLSVWNQITPERKVNLFENLEIINENDTLMDFNQVAKIALADANAAIRAAGLRMLWEYEDEKIIPTLIELLKVDYDPIVRSQAAAALGKYIFLGELEEIHPDMLKITEESLLQAFRSPDEDIVRLKSLEALGYSSREEIPAIINSAFNSGKYEWIASALVAMGRSADENWRAQVLTMLAHPDERIQKEAVKAAGELEIKQARKLLLKLVLETESDEELWCIGVWALSKIGGDHVNEVFDQLLENATTDEEIVFLEEALDNLFLTEGIAANLDLMGFSEPDINSLREVDSEDDDFDYDAGRKSWIDELEEKLDAQIDDDMDDEEFYEEGEEEEEEEE